LNKIKIAINF